MREVAADVGRWQKDGEAVALATVVTTWGSAPRGVGSKMALTPSGKIAGSVSGGCVEGAVYSAGVETLESGRAQLLSFGVADETAWEVGLACGGHIDVFVASLDRQTFETVSAWEEQDQSGAVISVIQGPDSHLGRKILLRRRDEYYGSIDPLLDEAIIARGVEAIATGHPARAAVKAEALQLELFIDTVMPQPTLIMVGGAHIAIALATIASVVGYRTIVVDPRRAFGSAERFPHVDRLVQAWPGEAFKELKVTGSTAVAMLSHDPKIDDPALKSVLPSPAFYIGALGSTRTHAKRRKRLLESGMDQELIERIASPIGLDINARTPEEIAVAVMAEIIAARRAAPEDT